MNYKVELKGRSHYLVGLKEGYGGDKDSLLVYYYPGGDVDTLMTDSKMMLGALYDLYQVNDDLKDGDTIETTFGNFICKGVHVIPAPEVRDTIQDFRESSIDSFIQDE